jgi:uncharacterized protein YozE (UPF0346 family)
MNEANSRITFREYIAYNKKKVVLNPCKDFIEDAIHDLKFPKSNNKHYILKYLRSCGACDKAIEGFNILFREFKKMNVKK